MLFYFIPWSVWILDSDWLVGMQYNCLYYRAVECLNLVGWRMFLGVQLFSGKRMVNVVPGTSLHVHITSPNYLHYFKGPYSLKQQNKQNPQRHWPNKSILEMHWLGMHRSDTLYRYRLRYGHFLHIGYPWDETDPNLIFFSRSYIYVQLFKFNCIEINLYIAIKLKLLERFKVILSIVQK